MVTMELNASGIAATAKATANKRHFQRIPNANTDSKQNAAKDQNGDRQLFPERIK